MPENISIKSDDLSEIARGQAVVEARQAIEGECRVLSVSAACSVAPGDVFAGEVRYSGKVKFDCLIMQDGKLECITAVAEFSDKISSADITSGMNPVITAEIVNTEASIENGTLKLTAVVDTSAYAVTHCDFTCLSEPEEGVYAEKQTIEYCTAVSELSETAYITDGLSNVKADEVLCAFSSVAITSAECGDDVVKLSGAVYTTVVARTDDDLATSYRLVTPFVKNLSAPGVTSDNTAIATAAVSDTVATLTVDGDSKSIELAITLALSATVVEKNTKSVAVDVFCADNELEATFVDAKLCLVEPLTTVTDSVDGQVALGADSLAADNVMCVMNTFCTVTKAAVEDKRVNIEGLVGGDIVYYNAEKNAVGTLAFRLPFAMPLSLHTESECVSVTATVTDIGVKIRRESVFDVKAEIAFAARLTSCKTVKAVCSVKLGAPIERPNATVIVHIAKPGETLWQAARALCCSPERVVEQNEAKAPYAGGERLVNVCG
ncbi:MAG: hypothetical protein J1G38_06700, partial [Clostridiales bacterium]|nr:hypothetical protein [Clostridiales bacterium]